jgi:hypothetical protein
VQDYSKTDSRVKQIFLQSTSTICLYARLQKSARLLYSIDRIAKPSVAFYTVVSSFFAGFGGLYMQTPQAHTPVTLMALFANAFKIEKDNKNLWLKGIYQDRQRESYSGYYYDRLKDEMGGQIMTVKLPKRIKHSIHHGGFYLFKGILDKDVRMDGVIEPVFVVFEVVEQIDDSLAEGMGRRTAVQQQKERAGYRDLDQMIEQKLSGGKKPLIALICGKTSMVLQDVFSALNGAKHRYKLVEHRVNLSSKKGIINAFAQLNKEPLDAIAIIRGGGPGLEIFDDVEIAEASLKLKPILVTAIGHAQDDTLLQQIADKKFTTPTALGNYLREMVEGFGGETAVSKTKLSSKNQTSMTPATWVAIVLLLLAIGILLGMMLSG